MNRLPIKFEEEVLTPAGIVCIEENYAFDNRESFYGRKIDAYEPVSEYEIAARGLEELLKQRYSSRMHGDVHVVAKGYDHITNNNSDKDFCECIFKAIRETYRNTI